MLLRVRNRPALGFIKPCLPSSAKAPPSGADWLHEIKHDGFRIMARRDANGVRLISPNGNDLTSRFPLIATAVAALSARSCFIDGEAIVLARPRPASGHAAAHERRGAPDRGAVRQAA
jgi:bifunctional non-homologous end joining protein LigD